MVDLLPSNALEGVRIGISVSESPDLARLGLVEMHFRLALAEIARCVLVSGGSLAYGGHLAPDGYTVFLMDELQKYSRSDSPLLVCLAWPEHRRVTISALKAARDSLGVFGEITCLDPDGKVIDPTLNRTEAAQPVDDPELNKRALSSLRRYMGTRIHGRVLLGGKRLDFQGEIPGVMEEALIAIELGHALYLAGGFGGVTADITKALRVDDGTWMPPRSDSPDDDPRLVAGRGLLRTLAEAPTWIGLRNGLTESENRRLAATHRPSDIAALVSLGLGRLRHQRPQT